MVTAVLSIFRAYQEPRDALKKESQEKVINYLNRHYDLFATYDLNDAPNLIERVHSTGVTFDAVLTNVAPSQIPFDPRLTLEEKYIQAYTKTLRQLGSLRERASGLGRRIPLVAYTAVKPEFEALFRKEGVDAIVNKITVDTWDTEAKKIKEALDSLIVKS